MREGSVIPDPAVAQLFKKLPVFYGIYNLIQTELASDMAKIL